MDDKTLVVRLEQAIGRELGTRTMYGEYGQLTTLDLSNLNLSVLPTELSQLSNLQILDLDNNRLSLLPVELGQLSNLQKLILNDNQLSQLPVELSQLSNLTELYLQDNLLLIPPPEIITQGTQAILTFLRELQYQSVQRYETKLLLVGEGGTGKSSLLRFFTRQAV